MLAKPSINQLRSLHVAVRQPPWVGISELLNAELAATTKAIMGATELHTVHELRGRMKLITELLETAANTQPLLEKLEKANKL